MIQETMDPKILLAVAGVLGVTMGAAGKAFTATIEAIKLAKKRKNGDTSERRQSAFGELDRDRLEAATKLARDTNSLVKEMNTKNESYQEASLREERLQTTAIGKMAEGFNRLEVRLAESLARGD